MSHSHALHPAILLLSLALSLPAQADYAVSPENPCGVLHQMGEQSQLYNDSDFDWNVTFTTWSYSSIVNFINAGAVKYFSDGKWIDNGSGDYRKSKDYIIPVPKHQTVSIVYCGASSRSVTTAIVPGCSNLAV